LEDVVVEESKEIDDRMRVLKIIELLEKEYPKAKTALF